jgi:hypothetical protein
LSKLSQHSFFDKVRELSDKTRVPAMEWFWEYPLHK